MWCRLLPLLLLAPPAAAETMGFDEYVRRFGKDWGPSEYAGRKSRFEQRAAEVQTLNSRPNALWRAGVNEFSDAHPEELRVYLGYNKAMREGGSAQAPAMRPAAAKTMPDKVDWRTHNPSVVTPVKSQGGCGSCWAFSAAQSIESHVALTAGVLLSLSPQQLNSCTPNPRKCGGSGGCTGATAQLAFNYSIQMGVSDIWHYPYQSGILGQTGPCRDRSVRVVAGITGFKQLARNDPGELAEAVAFVGPVSVSVDASRWFLYMGGIFDECNKTHPDINHAVQLVGYGSDEGTRYWLVRNSWGASWGEDGYIRLKRWDQEPCGSDINPRDGFGCEGGPPEVEVCGECGILSDSAYPLGAYFGSPPRRLQALV